MGLNFVAINRNTNAVLTRSLLLGYDFNHINDFFKLSIIKFTKRTKYVNYNIVFYKIEVSSLLTNSVLAFYNNLTYYMDIKFKLQLIHRRVCFDDV